MILIICDIDLQIYNVRVHTEMKYIIQQKYVSSIARF